MISIEGARGNASRMHLALHHDASQQFGMMSHHEKEVHGHDGQITGRKKIIATWQIL